MNFGDIMEIIIYAVLAIFGVSARELRYKDIRHLEIARLISSMIVAAFGATIVYFLSSMTALPLQMGYILAGLVGWGGPQILDKIFEKNTGFNIPPIEPTPKPNIENENIDTTIEDTFYLPGEGPAIEIDEGLQ